MGMCCCRDVDADGFCLTVAGFSFYLQNVVSKSAIQFKGNSQHDAQEFLLWLLDRVHEDLNHIVHPDIRPQKVTSNLRDKYFAV